MASPFRFKTALLEDALRVHTCVSREGLSDAGDTVLALLSERKDIQASELLGKPATLTIALRDDAPRYLSGYVTRFAQRGFEGKHCVYEMQLKPWLWLLSRTSNCRIFQELSVPDLGFNFLPNWHRHTAMGAAHREGVDDRRQAADAM